MTRDEFVQKISELVEEPVTLETPLADVAAWDSMSAIGFVAMADAHLNATVNPQSLYEAQTVADLIALVAEKLT